MLYDEWKASRGVSPAEIQRKAAALEGVLVPLPAEWGLEGPTAPIETRKLIAEYLERFGAKPCCFMDLQPYLGLFVARQVRREHHRTCSGWQL